ncbi:penicillin-binding protein 2 [Aristophania vespae]|uniref:Penicillin-binding protein 2 n=1 Tax=Aristophania vespae TaxID=2697033 RepID=A0A6P1N9P0_9PROT|nr:penicillin-binding protein 2 [Aristophania vespae]QHI95285.1 penicillin-binding protein 2 [Aristophania vespae]UMM64539.1 Peptidoglycan D,D-transpeptidase MrdA [Aristophania vespae]
MFFKRSPKRPKASKRSGHFSLSREDGASRAGRSVFTRRALLLIGGQIAVVGTLAERLYSLQVIKGDTLKEKARRNRISKRLLAPPRGTIYDRSGILVAGNRVNWRALLMPEETTDIDAVVHHFSKIIPLDENDRARIERDKKHLKRYVPLTLKEFLSWDDMARIGLNAPRLPGVLIDVGTTREYPHKDLMAHIVGYVAPPNEKDVQRDSTLALPGMRVGRAGLELTQEPDLKGEPGSVEMEVNALGRVIGEIERVEGVPGHKVGLTIDTVLQAQVLSRLGERIASAVVMDCRNGEVMSLVSTPSFDPTLFDSGVSHKQWKEWITDPRTPLVDKAVAGVYPPGSTFKPAVALAALSSGKVSPTERFNCPGHYDMGGVRFHCWNRYGHGQLTMHEGLKYSCDVYFYQVARRCGMEEIKKAAESLGLGTKLSIELPHVHAGLIPTPQWRRKHGFHWNGGDTVNAGIGQGFVQVTPLALATYVSSIASGKRVHPHLIRTLDDRGLTNRDHLLPSELPFSKEQLDVIRRGMFAVVNEPHGTAPAARLGLPGILMAGKTGSAQVRRVSRAMRESGHFNSMNLPWQYRPHALFICFAPYDNPRYAVSVVVEHGNAGAREAAPLARQIMTDTLLRDPASRSTLSRGVVASADPFDD